MTTQLTESDRADLVAAVTRANLCCPEAVCDAVLAAAERDGVEAGRVELRRAKANDAAETARL